MVKNCKFFLSLEKLSNKHLALPAIFKYLDISIYFSLHALINPCMYSTSLLDRSRLSCRRFVCSAVIRYACQEGWFPLSSELFVRTKEIVRNIAVCVLSRYCNSLTDRRQLVISRPSLFVCQAED